jgi:hypothetical protein
VASDAAARAAGCPRQRRPRRSAAAAWPRASRAQVRAARLRAPVEVQQRAPEEWPPTVEPAPARELGTALRQVPEPLRVLARVRQPARARREALRPARAPVQTRNQRCRVRAPGWCHVKNVVAQKPKPCFIHLWKRSPSTTHRRPPHSYRQTRHRPATPLQNRETLAAAHGRSRIGGSSFVARSACKTEL